MLLARMATHKAKPNGQYLLSPENVLEYLTDVAVCDIPGVGYITNQQLIGFGIRTCGQLRDIELEQLQAKCGEKKGKKLWMYARGMCEQKIQTMKRRKSIGLDVNYGIRFDNQKVD
jgi:DNA repair protein REV1